MRNLEIGRWSLTVCLLVAASPASAQTTIETDGDVEAQGFIGDGSQVTDVDAATLDGSDSSDFAGATETAAVIAALQAQVNQLLACGSTLGGTSIRATGRCWTATRG